LGSAHVDELERPDRAFIGIMFARIAVVTVVSALALAPFAFATERRSQQVNITGSYSSNWDDVRLVQDGDRVQGTYVCCGGGTIEGRIIEGRTLRYVWRQPSGWGLGVWKIDSKHLDGTWGTGQNEANGGRWDLERMLTPKKQIAN
jgi:hypothetical protein